MIFWCLHATGAAPRQDQEPGRGKTTRKDKAPKRAAAALGRLPVKKRRKGQSGRTLQQVIEATADLLP